MKEINLILERQGESQYSKDGVDRFLLVIWELLASNEILSESQKALWEGIPIEERKQLIIKSIRRKNYDMRVFLAAWNRKNREHDRVAQENFNFKNYK